jgi:hypothetical protein
LLRITMTVMGIVLLVSFGRVPGCFALIGSTLLFFGSPAEVRMIAGSANDARVIETLRVASFRGLAGVALDDIIGELCTRVAARFLKCHPHGTEGRYEFHASP